MNWWTKNGEVQTLVLYGSKHPTTMASEKDRSTRDTSILDAQSVETSIRSTHRSEARRQPPVLQMGLRAAYCP
jgi:hypothetical protein